MSSTPVMTHSQLMYHPNTVLPYLSSSLVTPYPHVQHAFFTRHGGVSEQEYASLNCRWTSQDEPLHIEENYARIGEIFKHQERPPVLTVNQIHGAEVVIAEKAWPMHQRPIADGIVTRCPFLVIGITTADCVPLILLDPVQSVIAAVHAGWRGASLGIVDVALEKMQALGARASHIYGLIGPSIHKKSYEVGPEVYAAFPDVIQNRFFDPTIPNHYLFDLSGTVIYQLQKHNIQAIGHFSLDTRSLHSVFFSCRHTKDTQHPSMFGTQFSGVMLRS